MATTQTAAPMIHMGGTGKGALVAGYEAAYDSLLDAIRALGETVPNQRDYHLLDSSAWPIAVEQHSARLAKLEAVRTDLETILGALADHRP